MSENHSQLKLEDIQKVISDFYTKVAVDPILSKPFSSVEDWPEHIERLTHFWWIKFGGERYMNTSYNPPMKHLQAGFNDEFLKHWLKLFKESLDLHLSPELAQTWFEQASRMGKFLSQKNEHLKKIRSLKK